ncbi:transposase [Burkholderia ubonensis]|uniref:transposase n=1 Tax=Burkholderia ubonensis TaxID=101571 RepID=UPI0039F622CC
MVEQTFEPDASVSLVARCNDINTNLLFRWRRQYLEGAFGPPRREHPRDACEGRNPAAFESKDQTSL